MTTEGLPHQVRSRHAHELEAEGARHRERCEVEVERRAAEARVEASREILMALIASDDH